MITLTLDIEDHRQGQPGPKRHAAMTDRLLSVLDEADLRATCFIVGDLCESDPDLVRRIAGAGHEIGLHSFNHAPLKTHAPETFETRTRDARNRLSDLTGQPVLGYRAPSFSLTRETDWVPERLHRIGFTYSSSILPAGSPVYGYPGAPRRPFRWPCGLLELPAPVDRVGPLTLPYLGGIYFRYLPEGMIRTRAARNTDQVLWNYLHPYDIDHEEPFCRPHGAPLWMSVLLWMRRSGALARFEKLAQGGLAGPVAPTFQARIGAGEFDTVAALPRTG